MNQTPLPLCDIKDMRVIHIKLAKKDGYLPQDISQAPIKNINKAGVFELSEAKLIASTLRKQLKAHGIRGSVCCEKYQPLASSLEAIANS